MARITNPPEGERKKWYLRLKRETVEISEATFNELLAKGQESFKVEESDGYFWRSYTLEEK